MKKAGKNFEIESRDSTEKLSMMKKYRKNAQRPTVVAMTGYNSGGTIMEESCTDLLMLSVPFELGVLLSTFFSVFFANKLTYTCKHCPVHCLIQPISSPTERL